MEDAENDYRRTVFLADLRHRPDRHRDVKWHEHQAMQVGFLKRHGLGPESRVLDLGCGPMRLGSALIPGIAGGWYYGQDINAETLAYGEEVLRAEGVPPDAPYTLFASDRFDLGPVGRPIDIAFANSLFSHLGLNSILTCLLRVRAVLAPGGVFFSTFFDCGVDRCWLDACPREKRGRTFQTHADRDPYHYPVHVLSALAGAAGFRMRVLDDYGHPTQTMASFEPLGEGCAGAAGARNPARAP